MKKKCVELVPEEVLQQIIQMDRMYNSKDYHSSGIIKLVLECYYGGYLFNHDYWHIKYNATDSCGRNYKKCIKIYNQKKPFFSIIIDKLLNKLRGLING